ncbi:hypothetical protein ACPUEX_11355 [Enterobacter vonholyi]
MIAEIVSLIKLIRDCVGDTVFVSLMNTPVLVFTAWYARRRYIRDRWFSSVSDKKRLAAFTQIRALWQGEPDDLTRALIRTIYESIGLSYPVEMSRQIVDALDKEGISYNDLRVDALLRCRYVMDISANHAAFSDIKITSRKRVLFWFPVAVLVIFCSGVWVLRQLTSTSVNSPVFIFFVWLYFMLWLWICSLSLNEWERLNKATLLWAQLSPYLGACGIRVSADSDEVPE